MANCDEQLCLHPPRATRNTEKRIVSLIVNPQFYKLVGELVLDLVVNPQFYKLVGELLLDLVVNPQFSESEIWKFGEVSLHRCCCGERRSDGTVTG